MSSDRDTVRHDFAESVNLTAGRLEEWLGTEESQSVGQKTGGSDESTGHESGRRIVQLLRSEAREVSAAHD